MVDRADLGDVVVSTDPASGRTLVAGASEVDVHQALELLAAARELQRRETNRYADMLLATPSAGRVAAHRGTNAVLDQRRDLLRDRLLASGSVSNAAVAALRGITESSARTFVARERRKYRLFTVRYGRKALVPQLLLDENGDLTAVSRAVEILVPLGLRGWELWSWLASPSGWLSGEAPAEMFRTDTERAMAAVRAYASELDATSRR